MTAIPAVHHVSAVIPAGEMTAIVGPNGAGKSTLLKALMGLVPRVEGRINAAPGASPTCRSRPRSIATDFGVRYRAARPLVALRRFRRGGARRHPTPRGTRSKRWGLAGFERRPIETLSIGQFQRVLFARLLLQDADVVVLLDEPFAAIDSRTVADLMEVIKRWQAERRTVVAVLHDLDQVRREFPNSLLLARELVDAGPTGGVLSIENLRRARAMAEAWDDAPTPARSRCA